MAMKSDHRLIFGDLHVGRLRAVHIGPDTRNVCVIILGFAASLLVLHPAHEYPIIDDWIYAQSVHDLLATGHFTMPWMSQATLVGLTYWGAGWSVLFGMSYTTLTYSTLAFALFGLLAFYGLARELSVPPLRALLGAAFLGFNPFFVHLSLSFMTDIPFIALTLFSCFAYCRGHRRHSPPWLLLSAGSATWAFSIRQIGLLLPIGFLLALALDPVRDRQRKVMEGVQIAALPTLAAVFWWIAMSGDRTTGASILAASHRAAFIFKPEWAVVVSLRALAALPLIGLVTILVAPTRIRVSWLTWLCLELATAGTLAAAADATPWLGSTEPPLTLSFARLQIVVPSETYTFSLVGNMIRTGGFDFFGYFQAPIWSPLIWRLIWIAGMVAGAITLGMLGADLLSGIRRARAPAAHPATSTPAIVALLMVGATLAFAGEYYDRYVLVCFPFLILYAVRTSTDWGSRDVAAAVLSLVVLGTTSVGLQLDSAAHDVARWRAVGWVRAQGFPGPVGFTWNQTDGTVPLITDLPASGFCTERTFPYLSRLSGFQVRYVLVQYRTAQAGAQSGLPCSAPDVRQGRGLTEQRI